MLKRCRARDPRFYLRRNPQAHSLVVINGGAGHGGFLSKFHTLKVT
jgi:hypothetical protein